MGLGVVFTNYLDFVAQNYQKSQKITLISTDSDYLSFAKNIKDELINSGFSVSSMTVSDNDFDKTKYLELFLGEDNILAVGNSRFLNMVRDIFENTNTKVCLILTDLNFSSVLSNWTAVVDGVLRVKKLKSYPTCLDSQIIVKLKKTAILDGFVEIASKILYIIDYYLDCEIKGVTAQKDFISRLVAVINILKNLDEDYAKSVIKIINAQYLLAELSVKCDMAIFGQETFAGEILSVISGQNLYSCQYAVFSSITKLYKCVLEKDLLNHELVPDYAKNILKLSEIRKCDPNIIFCNYSPLSFFEIQNSKIINSKTAQSFLNKMEQHFDDIMKNATHLFSGRKKICKFSFGDMKTTLCVCGYENCFAFYKLINDSGFFES